MDEGFVKAKMKRAIEAMGLDLTDPNLQETPARMARMYVELFRNVGKEYEGWKVFPNKDTDQIIMGDNIHFTSTCSHHFLPFVGKAWLLYIPGETVVGLSKLSRVVEHYAARPQIQENLGTDILQNFVKHIKPKAFMIMIRAIHQCMSCRGVKQYAGAGMTTSAIHGEFTTDASAKAEALQMIAMSMK